MAEILSYSDWTKKTYSLIHPRSTFLKAVDEALKMYDTGRSPANKEALKTAFDRWRFEQSKQGKDFRKSVRNQKGAVTELYRALNDLDRRNLSDEELEAMKYIARMQTMALARQFSQAELRFKSSTLMGVAQGAGSKWQKFKTGAQGVAGGASTAKSVLKTGQEIGKGMATLQGGGRAAANAAAHAGMADKTGAIKGQVVQLCRTLCPELDPDAVFRAVGLPAVEQFAIEMAPFVGAISSGGKAVVGWIGVVHSHWQRSKVEDTRFAIATGDPEAAFDAVLVLLDREIMSATAKASVKTAAFTGKLLGAFADAGAVTGPVIGLLEIIAQIFQTIVEYVVDYRECQAGTRMLKLGALNLDLFETSPILGCYFIVVQDHSTIINFAVGDYGTPNWMFDVERLMKKVQLVLDKAQHLIHASKLEVAGAERMKGVVVEGYSVKTGMGKLAATPDHVKGKITDGISAWFVKPEKPMKVDPSRIVGFGSSSGGRLARR